MKPHYLCLKSSKTWQTRKGWIYVREGNELVHYSRRYQTRLLNADQMLAGEKSFQTIPDADLWLYFQECYSCDCDECRQTKQ